MTSKPDFKVTTSNNSQAVPDRAIVTMAEPLNRAIFNDLVGPQTQILSSGHSLTLNVSEMATDTGIVTMEGE